MPKYDSHNYPVGDGSVTKSHNGAYAFNADVPEHPNAGTVGYPDGKPKYAPDIEYVDDGVEITPDGHFMHHMPSTKNPNADTSTTFLRTIPEHFIKDVNTPVFEQETNSDRNAYADSKRQTVMRGLDGKSRNVPIFSGSTTPINPLKDDNVADIAVHGLYEHEKTLNDGVEHSLSPMVPFFRVDPTVAQASNIYYYNRTKLPVADLEWRKGFRHIFITRPECYIMGSGSNGQPVLSEQCENDREMLTAYHQFPHLLNLLSPSYITGSPDNFNYLLSNRVQGMQVSGIQMSIDETMQKSVNGYTINPSRLMVSNQGGSLDLQFRDTKRLEVYNCLRLWMLYDYKTYRGTLAPSYNGYQYSNSYSMDQATVKDKDKDSGSIQINKSNYKTYALRMHPYDRALDYCATLFDIITDESGLRILYWCKYYGIYPMSVSPSGLSNNNNQALTQEMALSAQFRYQRKMEMNEMSFVEFNYNAGVVNADGSLRLDVYESLPWYYYSDSPRDDVVYQSKTYMGAAGMFTGSPYIVLSDEFPRVNPTYNQVVPMLCFKPMMNRDAKGSTDYHVMNNYIEHDYPQRNRPTAFTTNPTDTPLEAKSDSIAAQNTNNYDGYDYAARARMEAMQRKKTKSVSSQTTISR